MNESIRTNYPTISIVLAIYNPNIDWLEQQLYSLNIQDYPNLELLIRDDCSTQVSYDKIKECVNRTITHIPYCINRNDSNMGSTKTFEILTLEAKGAYIAYCDQDDIWYQNKISRCECKIRESCALLVCSDVQIIDGKGQRIAESILQVRPRHVIMEGEHLDAYLLYRNFVIGCTSLVVASLAQQATPFPNSMIHDHYLALYVSTKGKIAACHEPLMDYRIHGGNQTGVLKDVTTKAEYFTNYISPFAVRVNEVSKRINSKELSKAVQWGNARIDNYFRRKSGWLKLIKLLKVNLHTSIFELIMLRLPNWVFSKVVILIQKGTI